LIAWSLKQGAGSNDDGSFRRWSRLVFKSNFSLEQQAEADPQTAV
jgi:hypothetical protein